MANVKFHKEARISPERLMDMVHGTKGAQFTPAGVLRIPTDGADGSIGTLEFLRGKLESLAPV